MVIQGCFIIIHTLSLYYVDCHGKVIYSYPIIPTRWGTLGVIYTLFCRPFYAESDGNIWRLRAAHLHVMCTINNDCVLLTIMYKGTIVSDLRHLCRQLGFWFWAASGIQMWEKNCHLKSHEQSKYIIWNLCQNKSYLVLFMRTLQNKTGRVCLFL